jgi:hypothetical protein
MIGQRIQAARVVVAILTDDFPRRVLDDAAERPTVQRE